MNYEYDRGYQDGINGRRMPMTEHGVSREYRQGYIAASYALYNARRGLTRIGSTARTEREQQ